ncbi:MAG: choice-of-anchor D domain-containing protein [Candidatus Polarisedimenticolaceae bacterium]|nr:choice-of-anchor D domain-containing protein [Candidatus Polarisedimenticolaceae bacterium]
MRRAHNNSQPEIKVLAAQKTPNVQPHKLLWLALLITTYLFTIPTYAAVMPTNGWIHSISDGISLPTAMAIGSNDNLYVAESAENRVLLLNPYGEVTKTLWGLSQPISITAGNDGTIYIGSADKHNVSVYSAEFQLLRKLGSGDNEFQKPSDLVVDSANNVYVVDSDAAKVSIYQADGSLKHSFGTAGMASGQFKTPIAIALNEAAAEIIVSDLASASPWTPSARIQIFDLDGTHKRSFYTLVDGIGYLRPFAITVDALDRIYVADAFQNSIIVYDSIGTTLGLITDQDHPFRTPMGLAYSEAKSRLFVASISSARIDALAIDSFDPALDVRNGNVSLLGSSYDFGTVWIGRVSDPKQVTLTNSGNGDLTVSSITLSNNGTGEFAIADGSDNCSSQTLTPLTSCSVSIVFSPTSAGSKNISLDIISDAVGSATTSIEILGTSILIPQHLVTVVNNSSDGSGIVQGTGINCGDDCSELYDEESSVTLTAVADEGSFFAGWAGAECGGFEACQITLSKAETVTATFSAEVLPTFTITATASAHGSISPAEPLTVNAGSDQTYTITPDSGYQVKTLLIDGIAALTAANSYTFSNITDNHTIDVEFSAIVITPFVFESGVVTETDVWVPILFSRDFTSPVVVASTINNNTSVTSNIRIRNITPTGFELRISQYETTYTQPGSNVQHKSRMGGLMQLSNLMRDKQAAAQQRANADQQQVVASSGSGAVGHSVRASYLVVEEGRHLLSDGSAIEARKAFSTQGNPSAETVFGAEFATPPIVLTAITSFVSDDDLVVTIDNVTTAGFNQQLTGNQPGQIEELSYVAWEPSTGIVDGIHFEVNMAQIMGDGVNKSLAYLNSHLHRPVILGRVQTTGSTTDQAPIWQFETPNDVAVRLRTGAQETLGYMIFSLAPLHPGIDSDGDGLDDIDEVEVTGTSPILADTDGDGFNDGDEKAYWGALWDADSDSDGVINLLDYDSDNDSFSDGEEVDAGSDPFDRFSTP